MRAIDQRDKSWWDSLTEEEQKKVNINNKKGHLKLNNQQKKKNRLKTIIMGTNKLKKLFFKGVSNVPIKES